MRHPPVTRPAPFQHQSAALARTLWTVSGGGGTCAHLWNGKWKNSMASNATHHTPFPVRDTERAIVASPRCSSWTKTLSCLHGKEARVDTDHLSAVCVFMPCVFLCVVSGRPFRLQTPLPAMGTSSPGPVLRALRSLATRHKFQRELFSVLLFQRSVVILHLKQQDRLFDSFVFYVNEKSFCYLSDCK